MPGGRRVRAGEIAVTRRWYDDEYGDSAGGTGDTKFEIQELIDSEVTLTHWTGPDGRRLEETSLSVGDAEVCLT